MNSKKNPGRRDPKNTGRPLHRVASDRIGFAPLTAADEDMLMRWMQEPHVGEWWGLPDEEMERVRSITRAVDRGKVAPADKTSAAPDERADLFVATLDGTPCAYVELWEPHGREGDQWYADQPSGTVAINMFVGPPDMLGRGVGSAVARACAERLARDGVGRIVVDPDSANERAVRAYARAGFVEERGYDDGSVIVMVFR